MRGDEPKALEVDWRIDRHVEGPEERVVEIDLDEVLVRVVEVAEHQPKIPRRVGSLRRLLPVILEDQRLLLLLA